MTRDTIDERIAALLDRPEMLERLQRDHADSIVAGADPTPDTAAVRLACLAVLQSGRWGDPYGPVNIDHPRFEEAIEAAASATSDKQAIEAATAILEGPDALRAFGLVPSASAMTVPANGPTEECPEQDSPASGTAEPEA